MRQLSNGSHRVLRQSRAASLSRAVRVIETPAVTQTTILHRLLCCPGETRSAANEVARVRTGQVSILFAFFAPMLEDDAESIVGPRRS